MRCLRCNRRLKEKNARYGKKCLRLLFGSITFQKIKFGGMSDAQYDWIETETQQGASPDPAESGGDAC